MTTPNNDLRSLAREFRLALEARLADASMWEYRLPSKDEVAVFCRSYLDGLFPLYFAKEEVHELRRRRTFWHNWICSWRNRLFTRCALTLTAAEKRFPQHLAEIASELVADVAREIADACSIIGHGFAGGNEK